MASSSFLRSFGTFSTLSTRPLRCSGSLGLNLTRNVLPSVARGLQTTPRRAALYANADSKTFDKVIGTKDRIVIVDFYADWCRPCRMLSPVIEKLTAEPNVAGSSGLPLDLVKVDTDSTDGQVLGAKYKISSLPTVVAFKNGELLEGFTGALPETEVKKFIDRL